MTAPIPGITPREWPPPQDPAWAQATQQTTATPTVDVVPTTAPPLEDNVSVADFSYKPKTIEFTVDGERFTCRPKLSVATMQRLIIQSREVSTSGRNGNFTLEDVQTMLERLADLFRVILKEESAERFVTRLLAPDDPLDMRYQVMPIMNWVLEQYGLRPTKPSTGSSTGSPGENSGTSSTAGASPEALPRQT